MLEKGCNQIAKQGLSMGRVAVEMAEFVRTAHHGCCVFLVKLRRVDGLRVLFFEVEDSPVGFVWEEGKKWLNCRRGIGIQTVYLVLTTRRCFAGRRD